MSLPIITANGYAPDTVFGATRAVSLDYGTGPGRAVLAFCEMDAADASITIDSCSAGGVAMTAGVALPRVTSANNKSRMFWLSGPTVPSGVQNTTVTLSGNSRKPGLMVLVLKDLDGAEITFGAEATSSTNSTTQTIAVATPNANALAVAFVRIETSAILTPNAETTVSATGSGSYLIWALTGVGTGAAVTLGGTTNTPTPTGDKLGLSVNGSAAPAVLTGGVTLDEMVASGAMGVFTAIVSGGIVIDDLLASGGMAPQPGTIITPVLKNNTGTVLANVAGIVVSVYDLATGSLVVRKTGLTSSAGGVVTITDAAIIPGITYAYEPDLSAALMGRRMPLGLAT